MKPTERNNKETDTFEKVKQLVIENKKIVITAAIVVILIIAFIIGVAVFGNKEETKPATAEDIHTVTEREIEVPVQALEENAHADVNELITTYCNALESGDVATITAIKPHVEDTEKIRIEKKSEYIEDYKTVTCYTKPGPVDGSYVAFVYYEIKFNDIDTVAPGLTTLYICKNEDGSLYINDWESDEKITDYVKTVAAQDDVVDLLNKVQVLYAEALEGDEALNTFMAELPDKLDTAVGEALAQAEAEGSELVMEEEPEEEPAPEESKPEIVLTTDTVNVRTSDSETADKVGKAEKGTKYTRLETLENGWSKIQFEGKEAFVKSEFLSVAEEEQAVGTEETSDNETAQTEDTETEAEETEEESEEETQTSAGASKGSGGKVTVKETVNVRKSASETGERLGTAYMGEKFELIMEQADGWCKIKYNGNTAYIKSDYVE